MSSSFYKQQGQVRNTHSQGNGVPRLTSSEDGDSALNVCESTEDVVLPLRCTASTLTTPPSVLGRSLRTNPIGPVGVASPGPAELMATLTGV